MEEQMEEENGEEEIEEEEMEDEQQLQIQEKSTKTVEEQEKEDKEFYEKSIVKFRNYVPKDNTLKKLQKPKVEIPKIVEQITERIRKITSLDQEDLLSLAPKKAAWDLQRDLEKKLDKLEKKTQKAIYHLIQEKLKTEKEEN